MRPFWVLFFLAVLLVVVWVWFGRQILSRFCKPVYMPAKLVQKEIVTAGRFGGLTTKRRDLGFRLEDGTTLTLCVNRRVFDACPYRASGTLTVRGRCFQCFEEDGADGVTVGRRAPSERQDR